MPAEDWAAHERLTTAHGSVGVGDGAPVVVAMHEQALERRADSGPFWLSLHASTAKEGTAVAATAVTVKVEQNA